MDARKTTIRPHPREFRRRTDTERTAVGESEAELRTALASAGLGIFDYYPLSGELRWNAAVREHFGLSPDAPVNYNVFLVGLHPDDRARVVRDLQVSMERRQDGRFRAEFRTVGIEDGGERLIAMSGQAFFNQGGEAVRMVATTQDITDTRSFREAFQESEQRIQASFSNAALGIVEVDREDRVVAANERMCRILEYPLDELLGKSVHELTAPEDRGQSDALNAAIHEGRMPLLNYEKRYLKRNGRPVWVHVTVSPIRDAQGVHLRSIGTVEDISVRKRLEEALRQSEERYRLLFDKSPLPKWVFDLETFRILEANEAAAAHYGYSREEFRNLPLSAIWLPDEFKKLEQWAKTCCSKGVKFEGQVQTRHRKKNGEVIDADVRYTEIRYNGRRAGLGVIIDITAQKRAGEALRTAQEASERQLAQLDAVLEQMTEGLVIFDPGGNLLDMNRAALEIHGFDSVESLRCHLDQLPEIFELSDLQGRPLPVAEWPIGRVLKGEIIASQEVRVVRRDTGRSWIASYGGAPVTDRKGRTILCIVTLRDITEQKRAGGELLRSQKQLSEMADAMPQLVWTARPDGTVDYYNRRIGEFEGFEQKPDGTWTWPPVLHPDDVERSQRVWRHAIETGETYQIEHRVRRRDGIYRWYLSRGEPARDAAGRIIKWYGTATDIDDLKQAQAALKRIVGELQRSNSELQQFAYVSSHDLQEPLRTVASYVELLAVKYQGRLDETADRYIAFAVEGANRMSVLLNDLLAYSRVGTRGTSFERVEMREVYEQAAGALRKAIKESGANLTRDELPAVVGDPMQLVLLLQNLIANAVKFSRPHTPPAVHVSAKRGADAWVFGVHDNGIGIEPRFYDRIFVIFQRLHTREEYAGTGMGLAICKRIVERHGGRIWVESVQGEGSSFYFMLPDREAGYAEKRDRQPR